jgi:hypothetical protein
MDNTAPTNMNQTATPAATTTANMDADNKHERGMPPAPMMSMNTKAPVPIGEGGAWSVRLQALWLLSPSLSVARRISFLILLAYICVDLKIYDLIEFVIAK